MPGRGKFKLLLLQWEVFRYKLLAADADALHDFMFLQLFIADYAWTSTNRANMCVSVCATRAASRRRTLIPVWTGLSQSLGAEGAASFCFFRWNHRQSLRSDRDGGLLHPPLLPVRRIHRRISTKYWILAASLC